MSGGRSAGLRPARPGIFEKIERLLLTDNQKILLLVQDGTTVERALAAMTGSAIEVRVTRQERRGDVIEREALLCEKGAGRPLVHARSIVHCSALPEGAVREIERKEKGIGSIIESFNLEASRDIAEVGLNPDGTPYRVYDITLAGKAAFRIREDILI